LSHCRGEFIARHDADDIAYPERLALQEAYFKLNSDCVAVGGSAWHIDEAGRKINSVIYSGDAEGDARRIPSGEPYLLHPFLMVRRSAIDAVGGYRHVFYAEDTDLYWRLKPLGRLHNLKEILGEYRIHVASLTSRSVLNARIGAIHSQLAALSEVRRAEGRTDIAFDPILLNTFQAAGSLDKMLDVGSIQLEPHERSYLEVSAAAKMLELRLYRKFRFTTEDRLYVIKALLKHRGLLNWPTKLRFFHQLMHLLRPKMGLRRCALKLRSLRTSGNH
jgi:glycosyltransferase involved in cell wall biosynthesis